MDLLYLNLLGSLAFVLVKYLSSAKHVILLLCSFKKDMSSIEWWIRFILFWIVVSLFSISLPLECIKSLVISLIKMGSLKARFCFKTSHLFQTFYCICFVLIQPYIFEYRFLFRFSYGFFQINLSFLVLAFFMVEFVLHLCRSARNLTC